MTDVQDQAPTQEEPTVDAATQAPADTTTQAADQPAADTAAPTTESSDAGQTTTDQAPTTQADAPPAVETEQPADTDSTTTAAPVDNAVTITPAPAAGTTVPAPSLADVAPAATTTQTSESSAAIDLNDLITTDTINNLNVSLSSKISLNMIMDYITDMAPLKPVDPVQGARHQVSLYRAITSIINNSQEDFGTAFSTLLKIAHQHRDGVFHPTRLFRFPEHIPLAPKEIDAFHRLLNMVKLTADPQSRVLALKQIDMQATTEHVITDHGKNRIMAFFGL